MRPAMRWACRSYRPRGRRRLARLADLSRSGTVPGALLPLEGLSGNPSGGCRACSIAASRQAVVTATAAVPIQIDGDPGGFLLPGDDSAVPAIGESARRSGEPARDQVLRGGRRARRQPRCGRWRSFPRPSRCLPPRDDDPVHKLRSPETISRDKIRSIMPRRASRI